MIDTPGPPPGAPVEAVRLTVGVILGPHGIHGELKVRATTDDPEHLAQVSNIFLGDEEGPRRLLSLRGVGEHLLIRLAGVDTQEEGRRLRGVPLRIDGADARPNEPDEFFLYQLIGLTALDEAGQTVGTVTDLIETGAHDVLVISPPSGPDLLLPNHPEFVPSIDPEQGTLVVRPLDVAAEPNPEAP